MNLDMEGFVNDVMGLVKSLWDGGKLLIKIMGVAVLATVDVLLTGYVMGWSFASHDNWAIQFIMSYGMGFAISGVSLFLIDVARRNKSKFKVNFAVVMAILLQILDVFITASVMELAPGGSGDPLNFMMAGHRARPFVWYATLVVVVLVDGFGEYLVDVMLDDFGIGKGGTSSRKSGGGQVSRPSQRPKPKTHARTVQSYNAGMPAPYQKPEGADVFPFSRRK